MNLNSESSPFHSALLHLLEFNMRNVLCVVVAMIATAVFGLPIGASIFYIETGRGLHPAPAGIFAFLAGFVLLVATGEMGEEE